jgi:hypothetical protein
VPNCRCVVPTRSVRLYADRRRPVHDRYKGRRPSGNHVVWSRSPPPNCDSWKVSRNTGYSPGLPQTTAAAPLTREVARMRHCAADSADASWARSSTSEPGQVACSQPNQKGSVSWCRADDRLVEHKGASGAEESGIAAIEDASVRGHEPRPVRNAPKARKSATEADLIHREGKTSYEHGYRLYRALQGGSRATLDGPITVSYCDRVRSRQKLASSLAVARSTTL